MPIAPVLDTDRYTLAGLDLAAHAGRLVTLDEPLLFGVSVADDLRWLRLLREVTGHTVRLRWRLGGVPLLPPDAMVHLVPPADGVSPETRRFAGSWTAGYRYGLYYYRKGPGFVTVKDVRPDQEQRRLVIGDGSEHFLAMAAAETPDDLAPEARAALADAVDADLVVVADGQLLVLPYRMRNWPVPYTAI
jgi:hypothetical protein